MPRKLDLRSGRPVWYAYRAPTVPTGKLSRDVSCDVLVVGMGISGAMLAESLSAEGLSVIAIDRRGPLLGSTPATTALVQFEIDVPLTRLSHMIGKPQAEQAWRRSRLATVNLHGRIEQLGINCGATTKSSLYLAGTELGPGELRDEAEARRQIGILATYMTAGELRDAFGIDRDAGILSQNNIALDPRRLTSGLLNTALGRKAKFYAPVEAIGVQESSTDILVATKDGPTITAKYLVLATGYELMDIVPSAAHAVISTWAIATRRQPDRLWAGAGFIWEASDPYLYMRATADGRVICGGEDEDFEDEEKRNALLPQKTKRIAEKLRTLMPKLDPTPEFSWTGSFGTTTTGLPFMGALPGRPRVFAVQGYGGNGITFSQMASEIIATTIAGGEDVDQPLFAFNSTGLVRKIVDLAGRITG